MANHIHPLVQSIGKEGTLSTKLERIFYIDALIHNRRYPSVRTFVERFEVANALY